MQNTDVVMNEVDSTEFLEELQRLPDLQLTLTPSEAFCVLAQLQLALRHPNNQDGASDVAHGVARRIQAHLKGRTLGAIAEMGWHSEFDQ